MPSISYSLSSFTKTNTDMAAGTTFTASASGSTVSGASITSATLYLSSIRTYSAVGYLNFTLGSGSGTTGTFASNSEYIRELVRERYRKKVDRDEKMKTLNAALRRGMADSAAGRVTPLEEAFEKIRAAIETADDESKEEAA